MKTSYFNKIFYLRKDEFCIPTINKKINTEAKQQGKVLKTIRENYIDKKKEKESILCEAGAFYTVHGIFFDFHACNSCIYESVLSVLFINFPT